MIFSIRLTNTPLRLDLKNFHEASSGKRPELLLTRMMLEELSRIVTASHFLLRNLSLHCSVSIFQRRPSTHTSTGLDCVSA